MMMPNLKLRFKKFNHQKVSLMCTKMLQTSNKSIIKQPSARIWYRLEVRTNSNQSLSYQLLEAIGILFKGRKDLTLNKGMEHLLWVMNLLSKILLIREVVCSLLHQDLTKIIFYKAQIVIRLKAWDLMPRLADTEMLMSFIKPTLLLGQQLQWQQVGLISEKAGSFLNNLEIRFLGRVISREEVQKMKKNMFLSQHSFGLWFSFQFSF